MVSWRSERPAVTPRLFVAIKRSIYKVITHMKDLRATLFRRGSCDFTNKGELGLFWS